MAVKELSGDELRERLFHTFRSRGVLDSLQSKLRNQLVTELEQASKLSLSKDRKTEPEQSSLFQQAANSLVAEHLRLCNYEYSLSVFLPESGFSQDKLLSVQDILHLLKIGPDSQIYNLLLSCSGKTGNKSSSKGFLWNFLCHIAASMGHFKTDATIQTDESHTTDIHKSSLDKKLSQVEEMYNSQAEKEKESWSIRAEQQILAYQRKCEQRKKEELEAEMKRFRSVELARMRLEESEKCQKEIKEARDMLEKDFAMKAEVLRVREKETLERLEMQRQMQEAEGYAQRQKILDDMQLMKDREKEIKQRHELNVKSLQLDEEKVKAAEEKLKLKEAAIIASEKRYDQKLKDEIQRYKLQCQEEFQNRLQGLELRQAQLKQDKENFDKTKTIYMGKLDQLEEKKEKVNQLQGQLDSQKFQLATVMQQKEHLAQKLDEMKDYQSIRENELVLKKEVETLHSKLEDQKRSHDDIQRNQHEKVKELQQQLSKPPAEWLALKEELKKLTEDAKRKQKEFREQLRKQDLKLQAECQLSSEYQRRYEEQVILGKELQRELNDLRVALRHTQNALNTELQRKKLTETELSETFLPGSFVTSPPSVETSARPRVDSEASEGNSTMELLAHSKAVFEKLEREAKGLEESYINFQSRMRNMGISFNDPRAVLVPCEGANITVQGQETEPQNEFVALSWLPGSPDKQSRDDRPSQFYTLPSLGISQLPQDLQTRYLATTVSTTLPTNHSVTVGDLEAKPGQPSVIAAPIKGSPFPGSLSTAANLQDPYRATLQKISGISHPSSSSSRRPLSSTIDPFKGDSHNTTQDTNIAVISKDKGNGVSKVHFHTAVDLNEERARSSKEKQQDDVTECESKSGSDLSVSSGMLTTGILKIPTVVQGQTMDEDRVNQNGKDTVMDHSGPSGFGTLISPDEQMPNISLDTEWQKDTTGQSHEEAVVTSARSHGSTVGQSADSGGSRPMVSLDNVWKVTPGIEKDDQLQHQGSNAVQNELRDKAERDARFREEREQEIRDRDENEWKAQEKRKEEERLQREQEAWEREQRELRELERLEREERERDERERYKPQEKEMEISLEEEDIEDAVESDRGKNKNGQAEKTEPEIDPIMLQYMDMIKKRKDEEKKAPVIKNNERNRNASKEAVPSLSNSELSQGDEDLGSIAGLSDNDGFDWG